jgi:predicted RNA-binding Zn-ribbon protein involved in translation (DUF1610 family)
MGNQAGNCWHCGKQLEASDYGREATCPNCGKYTHVCKNCRFFAPGKPNSCLEPIAEPVTDKTRANFCGYFEPTSPKLKATSEPSADDLRKAAEDLFK